MNTTQRSPGWFGRSFFTRRWGIFILTSAFVAGLLGGCVIPAPVAPTAVETATPAPLPTQEPTATPIPEPETPEVEVIGQILDDFEAQRTAWKPGLLPNYGDSDALAVALSDQHGDGGSQSLALIFDPQEHPKAIFFVEKAFDFSDGGYLQFSLTDPDGQLSGAAISLSTGDSWLWHESEPVAMTAGRNVLTFDLQSDQFKTEATGWAPGTAVANLGAVQRLALILFFAPATTGEGTAYLDTLQLLPADAPVQPSAPLGVVPAAGGKSPMASQGDPPVEAATQPSEGDLMLTPVGEATVGRFQTIEFELTGAPRVDNPFDPAQIDLRVTFQSPSGAEKVVSAFWYQPHNRATYRLEGDPHWRVRFTPDEAGEWQAIASLAGSDLQSSALSFAVTPSDLPGFVRVDAGNPRFFAFDNGERFFPIGNNVSWWNNDALRDYERWLDAFSANGGNTIRVWMASWAFGIEWRDTPLGDYRNRMRQAWLLDQLFEIAEERGVQIILVFNNHGQFSQSTNPEWENNPYNAALGGPLLTPGEFATNPEAIDLFQRRLRYIASRWGHAPNLLAWEWWNEFNFTPIGEAAMIGWIEIMTPVLKEYDAYDHLITISGPSGPKSAIWQMPEIDFVSHHEYTTTDGVQMAPSIYQRYADAVPGKPILLAEFGFATGIEDTTALDQEGIHLHNGLWATTFSGYGGTGMYWWWDTYIHPLGLWKHFGALSTFLAGEDPAAYTPTAIRVAGPGGSAPTSAGMAMKSEDTVLVWVRSNNYVANGVQQAYTQALRQAMRAGKQLEKFVFDPPLLEDQVLILEGIEDAEYAIRWYDPQTGEWLDETTASAVDGRLQLSLPPFTRDVAAQIVQME
jgi:hypothetical protein